MLTFLQALVAMKMNKAPALSCMIPPCSALLQAQTYFSTKYIETIYKSMRGSYLLLCLGLSQGLVNMQI